MQEAVTAYLKDELKDNPDRVHRPRRDQRCEGDMEESREKMIELEARDIDGM